MEGLSPAGPNHGTDGQMGQTWPSFLYHGSADAQSLLCILFYHLHDHKVGEKTHSGSVIQAILYASTSNILYIFKNDSMYEGCAEYCTLG